MAVLQQERLAERCMKAAIDASSCDLVEPKCDIMHRLSARRQSVVLRELIEDSPGLSGLWARWSWGYRLRVVHWWLRSRANRGDSLTEGLWPGSRPGLRVHDPRAGATCGYSTRDLRPRRHGPAATGTRVARSGGGSGVRVSVIAVGLLRGSRSRCGARRCGAWRRWEPDGCLGASWGFLEVLAVVVIDGVAVTRTLRLVYQGGWRDSDALARRLEPVLVRTVLHDAHLTQVVHVAVLAHHLTGRQLRLYLEAAICSFIAVSIGTVLVVPATAKGRLNFLLPNQHFRFSFPFSLAFLITTLSATGSGCPLPHFFYSKHTK
jgi:hypothetical protein